jgi:uncharacterized membrane protein
MQGGDHGAIPESKQEQTMIKTFTFAAVHMSVAFAVGYAMTGSAAVGGALALVEPLVNTVAYYFHEKAWNAWGGWKPASPPALRG